MAVVAHFGDVFPERLPLQLGGTSPFLKGRSAMHLAGPALAGLFEGAAAGTPSRNPERRVVRLAPLLRLIATAGDVGHQALATDSIATTKEVSPIVRGP